VSDPFAVDSSALVAIIRGEDEADAFVAAISAAPRLLGWPTLLETKLWCLHRLTGGRSTWLEQVVADPDTTLVAFDGELEAIAFMAYERFGRGRHLAGLNFGDAMSYAVAAKYDVPLLFKGKDFGATDLRAHAASAML